MHVIEATIKDLDFLVGLRNEPVNVAYSRRGELTPEEIRQDYFNNPQKKVYIAVVDGKSVGYLIFEFIKEKTVEISVAVSAALRGKGLGSSLLKNGTGFAAETLGVTTVIAQVFPENKTSLNLFRKQGYVVINSAEKPWELAFYHRQANQ